MPLALRLALPALLLAACAVDAADPAELTSAEAALRTSTEPDPDLTPGSRCTVRDPDFDGHRYRERIAHCRRAVSRAEKAAVYDAYAIPRRERGAYEIDHRISLSLGGDNSFENLWPLVAPEARRKAAVEQRLYDDLAAGRIDQAEAIAAILAWR